MDNPAPKNNPKRQLPILYSFRRCPFAMRARMAVAISNTNVELREIVLRDKPEAMLVASPKATVPVLVLENGEVLEESLYVMQWALARNDPENWLGPDLQTQLALIEETDGPFKHHLDRYKYATRYEDTDPVWHREQALEHLRSLNQRLEKHRGLVADFQALADHAIFPFIRQFANTDRRWFDTQPLGALQAWLDKHLSSSLFLSVMQKYPPWRKGDTVTVFPQHAEQELSEKA